jgi:hypothetical protein
MVPKDPRTKMAGPQSYGDAMGRQAWEDGSTLANMVFMSHGAGPKGRQTAMFDTAEEMRAAGFNPRYPEITELALGSLSGDEQLLLKRLQITMVSFAFIVNSNGALQSMQKDNASKFLAGLGPSVLRSMVDSEFCDGIETAQSEVLSEASSVSSAGSSTVLNLEKPGAGDLLEHFILKAVIAPSKSGYAFVRAGPTGFDTVVISIVQSRRRSHTQDRQDHRRNFPH